MYDEQEIKNRLSAFRPREKTEGKLWLKWLAEDVASMGALVLLLLLGLFGTAFAHEVDQPEPRPQPYMVTDEDGYCLFIAVPGDTYSNGEPIGIECGVYYDHELGEPMTKTEFNTKFGNENFQ